MKIANGVVHTIPKDLKEALFSKIKSFNMWEDITALARNEWICWIESAKRKETREKRIQIACENLAKGKRRPCCWAGCPHR